MNDRQWCAVTPTVRIPMSEISFSFSRSSGSGGQHVNKVNTRVTLRFDIGSSSALTDEQKQLVRQRLAGRINRQGILLLHAEQRRSQRANREEALQRFAALLRQALHRDKVRRRTRPGRSAKERRLKAKRLRGRIKAQRRRGDYEGY
ncbi:MAG TPA: aminoacyl-tRNA hydrolase [Desulfobulbus sp.]|nr:aminoacyl-tRNA hydrolase [Desulfobulbus sp.]